MGRPINPHIQSLQVALGIAADGLRGPATNEAILAAADTGRLTVGSAPTNVQKMHIAPVPAAPVGHPVFRSPPRADMIEVFGYPASPKCTAGRVDLPLPFTIAWDQTQMIRSFACHILLAPVLTSIFSEAVKHYGEMQFCVLDLDQFGGCFAHRAMRGGTDLSVHSWGAAVDLDPMRNQLKWGRDKAAFAKPEYEAFWNIVEDHGGYSLGRRKNYDWMHFQFVQA